MSFIRPKRQFTKNYRARNGFNGRRQLVSDVSCYAVTWMPQRKIFMIVRIFVFEFELFISVHLFKKKRADNIT